MKVTEKTLARLADLAATNVMAAAEFVNLQFRGFGKECYMYSFANVWAYAREASFEPIEENSIGRNTKILTDLLKQEKLRLKELTSEPKKEDDSEEDYEGLVITTAAKKAVTTEDLQKALELKEQELRVAVLNYLISWVKPYKAQERQEIINAANAAERKAANQAKLDELRAIKAQRDSAKLASMSDEDLEKAIAEAEANA